MAGTRLHVVLPLSEGRILAVLVVEDGWLWFIMVSE